MIYAKLDWYTVLVHDVSISDLMNRLELQTDLYEEFLNSSYERSYGFVSNMVFAVQGISFEIKFDDFISHDRDSLFEVKYSKVRLDISGQGLDYLRSRGINVEECFTSQLFWLPYEYNVTRSDFAFDFVNYQPNFLTDFIYYIQDEERAGFLSARCARLQTGTRRCVQYSYRLGDQQTLYLGAKAGDKLIRIYNKLLQYQKNGVLVKPLPEAFKDEGEVTSWFRIELQTRRKSATEFLFGTDGDLKRVLRTVFDNYKFIDRSGRVLPFIENLYDWEKIPAIIQNANFV